MFSRLMVAAVTAVALTTSASAVPIISTADFGVPAAPTRVVEASVRVVHPAQPERPREQDAFATLAAIIVTAIALQDKLPLR